MPRGRNEPTASSLLGAWTDADTAMHIVGTRLGVFDALDPDRVLAEETPLRGALFDILLSLVEGGALEMRTVGTGRFAFRWRADYVTAGLASDGHESVDVEPPSPHLAEIARLRLERDDALGRAAFAESLAEERERLLRLAGVPVPATRVGPPPQPEPMRGLDPESQSVLDVLYASRSAAGAQPSADRGASTRMAGRPARKAKPTRKIVRLPPPAEPPEDADGPKWTGYSLEQPAPRLSTIEPLAGDA